MEILPLILIPFLYFLLAFIKPYIQPKLPFNLCSLCVAVSATWGVLLVLWIVGVKISLLSIGILMGMSVSGAMYKLEKVYEKKKLRNFWFVRLILIVGGLYLIQFLLEEEWNLLALLVVVFMFAVFIATFFFQGKVRIDEKNSIIKRLDDCC